MGFVKTKKFKEMYEAYFGISTGVGESFLELHNLPENSCSAIIREKTTCSTI